MSVLINPITDFISEGIDAVLVEDMEDGGMSSIRFLPNAGEAQSLGQTLAEAVYIDEDGISVSIIVNADEQGRIYELDFWKVDFSPLRSYPSPEQLQVKK